ncbi:DUF2563 family protein [Mycolicibacter sinensis]|uniref:DUF2563 domain-containing protein n=1 Tax=Mycolicibacter sinensis (strain JDM601) TaxID=875328 RepID=A0A1A2Y1A2_MYCSD|nr:DUF2563 family protein [Mycolicibacter sinensis]OBH16122.1 hypothetical protein A5694_07215 [Mycolicibacter sinensis]OBI31785.1 hypothetical protein A5710_16950 [Mycolicibacter sinensis]
MYVDRGKLRYGAADSGAAGEHAQAGGEHLAGVSPTAGMFGDFPDARGMHETLSAAHQHHNTVLNRHREVLEGVAATANYAEKRFGAMDEHHAQVLRAVRPD